MKGYILDDSINMKSSESENLQIQNRFMVSWGWGKEWRLTANRNKGSFLNDGNDLKLDGEVG